MVRVTAGAGVHRLFDESLKPAMRAIGLSLGPDARSILYGRESGAVAAAATGFTIAREMPADSGSRGTALRLLKEALFITDRDLGDGTARLALMAGATFSTGAQAAAAGVSLQGLCEEMNHWSGKVAEWLVELRSPDTDTIHIARSCGLNEATAEKLGSLVRELGSEAIIDLKENDTTAIEIRRADGFVLDAMPLGKEALSALSSPSILVADEIINDFGSLARVLEGFVDKRRSLVIVARDITGPALATLTQNQQADVITVAALRPSEAGQRAADSLEDLAIASGATLIAERFGHKIERIRPDMLGQASDFRFAGGRATFLSPKGKAESVAVHRKLLALAAEKARYLSYDREVLERRGARLGGQWCELRLAGATHQETSALIVGARAAVSSMQSALRYGAVTGGGGVFDTLAGRLETSGKGEDERAAARAIACGLRAVPHWLKANSGYARAMDDPSTNAVQDPLALTKATINQAVSLAQVLLRTAAVVTR